VQCVEVLAHPTSILLRRPKAECSSPKATFTATLRACRQKAFWKGNLPEGPTFETTGYSDFQATVKLVPSDVRADGTASSAPPLLTIMISCTSLPNALIGPDVEVSVA
jgi:hypothetical protein